MSPRKPTSPGPATAVAESTVPVVVAVVAGAVVENTEAKDPNRLCPKCNRPLSEDPPSDPDHDLHDLCYLQVQQEKNTELLCQVPKLREMVAGRLAGAAGRFDACFKSADRAAWPPEGARALVEAEQELKLGDADAARARAEGAPGAYAPAKHHYFRAADAITKAFYFKHKKVVLEVLAQLSSDVAKGPNEKFRAATTAFQVASAGVNGRKKSEGFRKAENLMSTALEAAIQARRGLRGTLKNGDTIGAALSPERAAVLRQVAAANDRQGMTPTPAQAVAVLNSDPPVDPDPAEARAEKRVAKRRAKKNKEGVDKDPRPKPHSSKPRAQEILEDE